MTGQDEQTELFPEKEVLDAAMDAGHILLENGAEISRVEETMERITRHYGVRGDFFVLSNGIFTTGAEKDLPGYARVEHIPVKGANLERVVEVNQLSRDIESQSLSLREVRKRLTLIRQMREKSRWAQVLASGLGSACFCLLFGGRWADALMSGLAGVILWIYWLSVCSPRLSKITSHLTAGALVTFLCVCFCELWPDCSLSHMIIGAIIPLVPGVPFTNGIRDIAAGDYISGAVRLLDAMLTFICIAIGVGMMISICRRLGGVTL